MMKKSVEPQYFTLDPHGDLDCEVLLPLTDAEWRKVKHRVADCLLDAMHGVSYRAGENLVEQATKEVLEILYGHFNRRG